MAILPKTYSGTDFVEAVREQRRRGIELHGKDAFASAIVPATATAMPVTTASYANAIWSFWRDTMVKVVTESIPLTVRPAWFGSWASFAATEGSMLPDEYVREVEEFNAVAGYALRGYGDIVLGCKVGAYSTKVANGYPVFDPYSCRLFWDGCGRVADAAQASKYQLTTYERWQNFSEATKEGVREAAKQLAHEAGKAAAWTGETLGGALGKFLEGIGLVNLLIVGGGIYVATKVI